MKDLLKDISVKNRLGAVNPKSSKIVPVPVTIVSRRASKFLLPHQQGQDFITNGAVSPTKVVVEQK